MYEIQDIGVDVDTELNSLEHNPNKLEDIVTKIDKINTILRKHSLSSIDELINFRNTIESKVSSTESIDLRIQKLKEEIQNYFDDLNSLAEKLHIKRTSVISIFSNDIEAILNDLGMPNAKFNIQIDKTDEHNSNGMNRIDFKFLANKGYDYKSLKNSASGGEISRIMLAVKSIIANYKQLPTIIFDEIDTGVSGEISKKMGLIMKKLGLKIQIFSITHLPQVAAMGQSHFKIYKEDNNGVTVTKMEKLNENNRIVEIANMLEGNNASESAYLHAKQLLN
jgi:DNA repair protein RecN (Recombination protein N)